MDSAAIKASVDSLTENTNSAIDAMRAEVDSIKSTLKRVGGGIAIDDNGENPAAMQAESEAIALFARTGSDAGIREIHAEMQSGNDVEGGYSVLPQHSRSMMQKLHDGVTMRRLSRVETMESGSTWVEAFDVEETGAGWVGERESRPETDNPSLGELKIDLDELYALQTATQRLIDDSQFDIAGWLMSKVEEKFVRVENAGFLNGDGIKKPRGILSYDTSADDDDSRAWGTIQTVNSGSASAVTADGLLDTLFKLRAPYRRGARFMMNSTTLRDVSKLKDGEGNYLFQPALTMGAMPTLIGYPVEVEENMPSVEAGANAVAFGNFSLAYTIVDRPGVKWLRDPYTNKGKVSFYAYRRVGGGLSNSEALKFMKISA